MSAKEWYRLWFSSPFYHKLYFERDEQEARQLIDHLLGYLSPEPGARMLDVACGTAGTSPQRALLLRVSTFHRKALPTQNSSKAKRFILPSMTCDFQRGSIILIMRSISLPPSAILQHAGSMTIRYVPLHKVSGLLGVWSWIT